MYFKVTLALFFLLSPSVVATTTTTTFSTSYPSPTGTICAPQSEAVQFMRFYNPTAVDHFYTISAEEGENAVDNLGYLREQNAGRIFPSATVGTVPLYRLYNTTISDNFYTISEAGVDFAVQQAGYTYNGIAGYVYSDASCGAVPFYRMYNAAKTDHFYTTSVSERGSALNGGYSDEGIDGYVLFE